MPAIIGPQTPQSNILLPKKFFIPLENNPIAFAHLSTTLGIKNVSFHDIYSLSPSDTAHIPRPVHALIINCSSTLFKAARADETENISVYDECGEGEKVLWFKQTINHACGLMAWLHAVCNGEVVDGGSGARDHDLCRKRFVVKYGEMDSILQKAPHLKPNARSNLLTASSLIEKAHFEAASMGATVTPDPMDPVDGHFICFVKGNDGHLWELNGSINGPIDRGALPFNEDALSEKALKLGVKTILDKAGDEDVEFSIVAMSLDYPIPVIPDSELYPDPEY